METRQVLVLCAALVGVASAGRHDAYSGYTVEAVLPRSAEDVALLRRLEAALALDVWQYGAPRAREALLMVAPPRRAALLAALDQHAMQHYLHTHDVAKAIEKNEEEILTWKRTRQNRMLFNEYLRYDEINAYLERLAAQYPDLATVVTAGKSFEGRDIKYLKISTSKFSDASKPVYFLGAMLHAREWVTAPAALYAAHRLLDNLRSEDRDLLQQLDWIILPLANPDGYEFSHTDERLWRKTRSVNRTVHETCFGVDANRNFDVEFNTTGVSADPCALNYPGTHPFSEPETGYIRDILMQYLNRIQIYMDIHSYGNWVLFGYGNKTLPENAAQLFHLGSAMGAVMDAMKLPKAGFYQVGNSATILYGSSGSAQDYGQAVGVPFSYTLELPGYGYDFLVPPQYVEHINEETWQGIAVSARIARAYYRVRYNEATTVTPTEAPTTTSTAAPTNAPTTTSTAAPTEAPTTTSTAAPTNAPTTTSTAAPTEAPTTTSTAAPTNAPTTTSTAAPTNAPTTTSTAVPTEAPTTTSTAAPTNAPTTTSTAAPTNAPTTTSTAATTNAPTTTSTAAPTEAPTTTSTAAPTEAPTTTSTAAPTNAPTTTSTAAPTEAPTTTSTAAPTNAPTTTSTAAPTNAPTTTSTAAPTEAPTTTSTAAPTNAPTTTSTAAPTDTPTTISTAAPTVASTAAPTVAPTAAPTDVPTAAPIAVPTAAPTIAPVP